MDKKSVDSSPKNIKVKNIKKIKVIGTRKLKKRPKQRSDIEKNKFSGPKTSVKERKKDSSGGPIVCVIPVLGRHQVLNVNLASLKNQSYPIEVLLVVSTEEDRNFAIKNEVNWVYSPNSPLGLKFQTGIAEAQKFKPKGILINGSDDILSLNWVERLVPYLDQYDVIGKMDWYVIDTQSEKTYSFKYKVRATLGAGRLISGRILDKLHWDLYPTNQRANLDHASMKRIRSGQGQELICHDSTIFVISIKGKYQTLNPTSKLVKSQYVTNLNDSPGRLMEICHHYNQNQIQQCLEQIKEWE